MSVRRIVCLIMLCLLLPAVAPGASAAPAAESPFEIRGIKGLWWDGIAKYRMALPWLAEHDMNFLMLCYTSFPASGKDWRADYSADELAAFRDLAAQGRKKGVTVCLSFNPGIWSSPPLSYSSEADYQRAWKKVQDVHATGIRWFALCLDDINRALLPEDVQRYGTLQAAQVHFVNRLWADMKTLKPRPRLIFCPSAYTTRDAKAHEDYTRTIGEGIDRDVMLFWTGPEVCSPSITVEDAREIGKVYHRKPFVWDNYPVNDMAPWRPLVGPVRNRDPRLFREVSGYMANPMKQWHASKIPLATLAAYYRDPAGYDPARALDAAIKEYPESQRPALRLFTELYGALFWGDAGFPGPPRPKDAAEARTLLPRYRLLRRDLTSDPGLKELSEDVLPTLETDIAAMDALSRGAAS